MTITRKMDKCFMVLEHFMMVAFLMIGAACYNQNRQPDFNDFVNQKIAEYHSPVKQSELLAEPVILIPASVKMKIRQAHKTPHNTKEQLRLFNELFAER